MKKIVCFSLVLTIIIFGSCAIAISENDISFLGIPWLSNESIVFQKLSNDGYLLTINRDKDLSNEECEILRKDEEGHIVQSIERKNNYCFSTALNKQVKGTIAGYPVSDIVLTFAYNGEYQLLYARVDLLGAEYPDIKNKLTKVYGNCEEIETIEGHTYLWTGANNSCVAVFEYYDGKAFDLVYGRLDAAEILENCLAPADPDDVSGL